MSQVYYVRPEPGNGDAILKKTYDKLKDEGYEVKVCGYGYPPIYVRGIADKEAIRKLVQGVNERTVIWEKHYPIDDKTSEPSEPQPHLDLEVMEDVHQPDTNENGSGGGGNGQPNDSGTTGEQNMKTYPKELYQISNEDMITILSDQNVFQVGEIAKLKDKLNAAHTTNIHGLVTFCGLREKDKKLLSKLKEFSYDIHPEPFDTAINLMN